MALHNKSRVLGPFERNELLKQLQVLKDEIALLDEKSKRGGNDEGALAKIAEEKANLVKVINNIKSNFKDDTFKEFSDTFVIPMGKHAFAKYKKPKDGEFDLSPITGFLDETLPTLAVGVMLGSVMSGVAVLNVMPMMAVVIISALFISIIFKSADMTGFADKDPKPLEDIKDLKEATEKTAKIVQAKADEAKKRASEMALAKQLKGKPNVVASSIIPN